MPVYEYECPDCGNTETILQKDFKDKKYKCKKCKIYMKKIISNNNFHLKGGGWAEDNYANKE